MEVQAWKHATVMLALALAASAGNCAFAAEQDGAGFYAGVSAGQSEFALQGFPPGFSATDAHQSSDIHALHAGWQANRYLAVELAVADIGSTAHFTGCYTPGPEQACVRSFEMTSRRADLAFVATLPLTDRFDLLGKLGIARYQHEISGAGQAKGSNIMGSAPGYAYDNGVVMGIGARFHITDAWALRAQWDFAEASVSYRDTRSHSIPSSGLDTWLVGVEYRFGE